ncbi:hypothetical protein GOP47_0006534 [Adiantum capillus-veneris]|uniref:Uncharacterized protein n=1 Tax=Adiantum capillus-veneris TaxID=13818 RepID=A0A9D4ZKD6_ADICA|nr:hypothetical protein GOP47_0006534 [Adiantum capillus-veneris]
MPWSDAASTARGATGNMDSMKLLVRLERDWAELQTERCWDCWAGSTDRISRGRRLTSCGCGQRRRVSLEARPRMWGSQRIRSGLGYSRGGNGVDNCKQQCGNLE